MLFILLIAYLGYAITQNETKSPILVSKVLFWSHFIFGVLNVKVP